MTSVHEFVQQNQLYKHECTGIGNNCDVMFGFLKDIQQLLSTTDTYVNFIKMCFDSKHTI